MTSLLRRSLISTVLMLSFTTRAASLPPPDASEVVHMWTSPKPDLSKPGAGYPAMPGAEHHLIFSATAETGGYNHHAKIIRFGDRLYAMWSNQKYAEDGPGQKVLYSVSTDGRTWSPAQPLFPSLHPEGNWDKSGINLSANGWYVWKNRLFARTWCGATVAWESLDKTSRAQKHDPKHIFPVRKVYDYLYREVKSDGRLGPVFSRHPEELPQDILYPVAAADRVCPGFVPETNPLKYNQATVGYARRLCEPTCYRAPDGTYAALFRDDSFSHRKFVTFSADGIKWSKPAPTDISDSPSASDSLVTSDGAILLIGNHMAPVFDKVEPKHYGRDPLMVSIGRDGKTFPVTYALRSGKAQFKVPAVRGRGGGAQYPMAIIDNDRVMVIYSMGKEDIWVSSFPLAAIRQ